VQAVPQPPQLVRVVKEVATPLQQRVHLPWPMFVPLAFFVPAHAPEPLQVSGPVQALPSLHAVPLARLDQAEVLLAGSQSWQSLPGLTAAEA
jgi:hypothetical protein